MTAMVVARWRRRGTSSRPADTGPSGADAAMLVCLAARSGPNFSQFDGTLESSLRDLGMRDIVQYWEWWIDHISFGTARETRSHDLARVGAAYP